MDIETKTRIKSNFKFAAIIVAVIVGALLLSGIAYLVVDGIQSNNEKEAYYQLSGENIDALFEISSNQTLMFDAKAYNKFENKCLGNENSNLLSFGCYCEKDDLICSSKDKTILTVGEKEIVISDSPASYINIIDNYVYYRNDSTRALYRYSISNNENECIVKSPCGEVVVSKKGVSYIDLTSSTLNYIQFDTMESSQVLDAQVKSFAVIGNLYYCLKSDKNFGVVTKDGDFDLIASDVDRFFCDGKIVIQKGNNIYIINETSTTESEIIGIEGVVIGFSDDEIYVNENQCVNVYNASTASLNRTIVELGKSEILKSFYILESTYEMTTYTGASSLYIENYKTIER